MLNFFSPIMLFQYAQYCTNYYAPNLPIMLKLCPLFQEGANLYVQIIILHSWKVQCSQPDCASLLPYFTAYQQGMGRETSRSGTGTRSEDETTSLPQTHYAQNAPIIPAIR